MITVRPYKDSVFYEYDIQTETPNGAKFRERKKTDCKTESSARRVAEQRLSYLIKTGFSELTVKKVLTLAEFWPKYLSHQEAERRKPATLFMRANFWKRSLEKQFGGLSLDEIGPAHFSQIKTELKDYAPGTVNLACNTLAHILRLAHEWKERSTEPPRVKYLKLTPRETKPYQPEEQERLLRAASSPLETCFLLLGLDAGLRVGELAALRRDDVDLKARRIEIRNNFSHNEPSTPKSESSKRTVYLTARLAEALKVQLKTHVSARVLFFPEENKIAVRDFQLLLGRLERRAGLPISRSSGAPHRLRHTFASRLAQRGATAKEIAALLGHSTLKESEKYIHLYSEDRPRAISLLDGEIGEILEKEI